MLVLLLQAFRRTRLAAKVKLQAAPWQAEIARQRANLISIYLRRASDKGTAKGPQQDDDNDDDNKTGGARPRAWAGRLWALIQFWAYKFGETLAPGQIKFGPACLSETERANRTNEWQAK